MDLVVLNREQGVVGIIAGRLAVVESWRLVIERVKADLSGLLTDGFGLKGSGGWHRGISRQ